MQTQEFISDDVRAASSTLGYLLMISIVFVSAGAIVVVGGGAISQSQEAANQDAADQAMTQFDSQMSLVAFDGSSKQTVDLSVNNDEQIKTIDQGHITLELKEINETHPSQTTTIATIIDRDMGTLVYETGSEYTVAYQGGGVWGIRNGNVNKTSLVSPPEFTFNDGTGTLPFVGVDSNSEVTSSNGRITMSKTQSEGLFPKNGAGTAYQNPVDSKNDLVLTIQSKYYRAWGEYFSDRLEVAPQYDHSTNTVTLVLASGDESTPVDRAILSTGGDNRIEINGQGGDTFVDSYNSSNGPYSASQSNSGIIAAESGFDMSSGAEVRGQVITEGDLILSGNSVVDGDATVNGNVVENGGGSEVTGDTTNGADINAPRPTDRIIESVYNDLKDNNDNNNASKIENGSISATRVLDMSNDPTVSAGEYHLSEFNVGNNENVTFDLQNGDIRIIVDDDVMMDRGDINVVNTAGNDNRVQIFTRGDEIKFDRSKVSVEGDDSTAMWFYGGAGTYMELHKSTVTGVLYAPGTDAIPGELVIETQSKLKGGAISGDTTIRAKSKVHYDQSLQTADAFDEQAHLDYISARIQYFHVSYTEVEIED